METYHLFAWHGFSCDIPADWNLAEYKVAAGFSCARFHDDFNLRLEFEWMEARRLIKIEGVRRRYDKIASSMSASGAQAENIEDMPGGWSACLYSMPDGKRLMAAFRLVPESNFFCLLKMYFENAGKREAERIVRRIAGTFRLYDSGPVPWAVYDVAFQIRKELKLIATSFQAGRKMLVFEWRLRRLYLMFFSLADMIAEGQSLEKWCAGYLNGVKIFSGVRFEAGCEGEIVARRRWRRFWGNVEPVTRGCFSYKAWCRLIPEKNQLLLGTCNYRHHQDLSFLLNGLDPALAPKPF